MRRTLSLLLALALAAAPAAAATLKFKDGTTLNCKVKSYDSNSRTLHVTKEDGTAAQFTMDQLDGRSVYLINASLVPKDDAKAQLLVAAFARDAGLYAHSMRRCQEALRLDPSMQPTIEAEMTRTRRAAAEMCMRLARAAVDKRDYAEAERYLTALVEKLPQEPEAEQAAALLDQYYAKRRAEKVAAADQKASDALRKDVERGKARYQEMVEKTKKGLQERGSSKAENLFRDALSDGKAVMKEIDSIEKKYKAPEIAEQVKSYRTVVTEQMVEVYLHIASSRATRSDYQGAQKEVNSALSLDPKNESALSMRARIEEYASQPIGGGRVWL